MKEINSRVNLGGLLMLITTVFAFSSCSFGDEPGICPYNTRLEYRYAGSSSETALTTYVDNLRQYLFDASGNLLSVLTFRRDSILGWNADLPPGQYTVVVWGNLGEEGQETVRVEPTGSTLLSDLQLSAEVENVPPTFRRNTARLYYGTGAFEVEEGRVCRESIHLSHAHAALNVTVQWVADAPPEGGVYRMKLKNVPAVYGFIKGWETEGASAVNTYAVPWIGNVLTWHETSAAMNYDGEVLGHFVTFRYTGNTHPLWSLYRNDEEIIHELDFYRIFSKMPMDMDRNIEQEFDLLVTVYEDRISVSEVSAADWDEGGMIYN